MPIKTIKRSGSRRKICQLRIQESLWDQGILTADLSKVYRKFISLMYVISTLLLVAREAYQVHNLLCYISRLLKLSTMCESPLHGPRNCVNRVRGRSTCTSCNVLTSLLSLQTLAKPKKLYQYRVGRKFQQALKEILSLSI